MSEKPERNQGVPEKIDLPGIQCVGVLSGKGGVGKSLVTGLLAIAFAQDGQRVGILDADVTGPSIPKMFGVSRPGPVQDEKMTPATTSGLGIKIMSLNLLMEQEDDPVIWRGPLLSKTVQQLVTDVEWGDVNYLFVDLPPGTSDVPLTVMQLLPLSGLIVVCSPQELAAMIVRKAIKMASMLNVRVLGLVENMTHIVCPKCGEQIDLFGSGEGPNAARAAGVPVLASIPVDPEISKLCDQGQLESYSRNPFQGRVAALRDQIEAPQK